MIGHISGQSDPDGIAAARRFAVHFTSSQSGASFVGYGESRGISAATDGASSSSSAPRAAGSGSTRRTDLARLERHLSERDWAILGSVAEHRFLTVRHLHALHFADLGETSGLRIAQRVLARLRRLGLLATLTRRVGGVRAGSGGLIHYVAASGDRVLRRRDDRPSRRRFTEPSDTFLRHTLAVADTRIRCLRASRTHQLELLRVQIEPAAWRRYLGLGGAVQTLKPDLYVETPPSLDSEFIDAWFIEVDLGSEQIPRLIRKCRDYEAYRAMGIEQEQTGGFPLVVWSLTDRDPARARRRRQTLREAIAADRTLTADLFRIVAPEDLVALLQRGGDA